MRPACLVGDEKRINVRREVNKFFCFGDTRSLNMPQTLAQKILQAHTDDVIERDGQIVQCRLSLVLANDITGPLAIKSFKGMGASRVFDKDKIALVPDHFSPC